MINNVLQDIQKGKIQVDADKIRHLLDITLGLKKAFGNIPNVDYVIDAIVPFTESFNSSKELMEITTVFSDEIIKKTLENLQQRQVM
ncbi:hypothetical protein DW058_12840 [Clostridiaceae bacterium AF42-6]|nr:hypothetical protein DW058_12840 [Clostridiaceae bacterium AF42-6]